MLENSNPILKIEIKPSLAISILVALTLWTATVVIFLIIIKSEGGYLDLTSKALLYVFIMGNLYFSYFAIFKRPKNTLEKSLILYENSISLPATFFSNSGTKHFEISEIKQIALSKNKLMLIIFFENGKSYPISFFYLSNVDAFLTLVRHLASKGVFLSQEILVKMEEHRR